MSEGMALPEGNRTGPNCGVTALAVAAGVPFEVVWNTIRKVGKRGPRWTGRTHAHERAEAAKVLGVELRDVPLPAICQFRRMSLERWVLCHAKPGVRYLVITSGHIQVVEGRTVLDQRGPTAIFTFWGRRKFVRSVQEVVR